jgi:hypothetical protein
MYDRKEELVAHAHFAPITFVATKPKNNALPDGKPSKGGEITNARF